jgi:hypothetical protein
VLDEVACSARDFVLGVPITWYTPLDPFGRFCNRPLLKMSVGRHNASRRILLRRHKGRAGCRETAAQGLLGAGQNAPALCIAQKAVADCLSGFEGCDQLRAKVLQQFYGRHFQLRDSFGDDQQQRST